MKPTKNLNTLKRRYSQLGVTVTKTVVTTEGHLVVSGFCCCKCGTQFFPDAKQLRNRHRCPNGCKQKEKIIQKYHMVAEVRDYCRTSAESTAVPALPDGPAKLRK